MFSHLSKARFGGNLGSHTDMVESVISSLWKGQSRLVSVLLLSLALNEIISTKWASTQVGGSCICLFLPFKIFGKHRDKEKPAVCGTLFPASTGNKVKLLISTAEKSVVPGLRGENQTYRGIYRYCQLNLGCWAGTAGISSGRFKYLISGAREHPRMESSGSQERQYTRRKEGRCYW